MNNSTVESSQGACPVGWHIPSEAEWSTLFNTVGGNVGYRLKETGSTYWNPDDDGDPQDDRGTNESGMSVRGAGELMFGSSMSSFKSRTSFQTSSENVSNTADNKIVQVLEFSLAHFIGLLLSFLLAIGLLYIL